MTPQEMSTLASNIFLRGVPKLGNTSTRTAFPPSLPYSLDSLPLAPQNCILFSNKYWHVLHTVFSTDPTLSCLKYENVLYISK